MCVTTNIETSLEHLFHNKEQQQNSMYYDIKQTLSQTFTFSRFVLLK